MRTGSIGRQSLVTLIATAALLCAAGAMVFAMAQSATGGGKPKLVVSEVSEKSRNLDGGGTYVEVLECPRGTKAISSSHDIYGGVGLIVEDSRRSRREWGSTLGAYEDSVDWNMHLYCARVR